MKENEVSMMRKIYTPSFVGISNWDIDASKLNRNVYLARPDMSLEDLIQTSETIVKYQFEESYRFNPNKTLEINQLSKTLSHSYREFRQQQLVASPLFNEPGLV